MIKKLNKDNTIEENKSIISHVKLKLDSSDYKKSKELNDRLMSLCNNFCEKSKKLKKEIEDLSKK